MTYQLFSIFLRDLSCTEDVQYFCKILIIKIARRTIFYQKRETKPYSILLSKGTKIYFLWHLCLFSQPVAKQWM